MIIKKIYDKIKKVTRDKELDYFCVLQDVERVYLTVYPYTCMDDSDFEDLYYSVIMTSDLPYDVLLFECLQYLIRKHNLYYDDTIEERILDLVG